MLFRCSYVFFKQFLYIFSLRNNKHLISHLGISFFQSIPKQTPSSSNPRSHHTVKLSSSGCVSCDKDCPGYNAYFICTHTVTVADKAGILTDFIKWHPKEKGGTNLTALANVGMPSSSGKKSTTSSKRKGAANKKPSNAPTVSSRLTCRETLTHPKPSCVWRICYSKHEISGQQSLGLLWLWSDTQARKKRSRKNLAIW